eukprot:scaffold10821_cov199-Amphora_coffeaeformis.AAC.1
MFVTREEPPPPKDKSPAPDTFVRSTTPQPHSNILIEIASGRFDTYFPAALWVYDLHRRKVLLKHIMDP